MFEHFGTAMGQFLGQPWVSLGQPWAPDSLGQPSKLFGTEEFEGKAPNPGLASHCADRLAPVCANDFLKVPLGPDFGTLTLA